MKIEIAQQEKCNVMQWLHVAFEYFHFLLWRQVLVLVANFEIYYKKIYEKMEWHTEINAIGFVPKPSESDGKSEMHSKENRGEIE